MAENEGRGTSDWIFPGQLISNPPHYYFGTPLPNTPLLSPSTLYLPPTPHSSFPPTLSHYPPIPREERKSTEHHVPSLYNVNLPFHPRTTSEAPSVPVDTSQPHQSEHTSQPHQSAHTSQPHQSAHTSQPHQSVHTSQHQQLMFVTSEMSSAQMHMQEPPFSLSSPPPLEHDPQLGDLFPLLLSPTSFLADTNADHSQPVPLRSLTPPPEQASPVQAVPGSQLLSLPPSSIPRVTDHDQLTPSLSLQPRSSEPPPGGCYIPPCTPDPAEYGFRVHFPEARDVGTTGSSWIFDRELRALFIRRNCDFAVTFTFARPCPPDCSVRALVCYKDPVQIQNQGVITRCLKHPAANKEAPNADHFIVSKTADAMYSELYNHKCVTVEIDKMTVSEQGPFSVFSYTCYSSCIVGSGKLKPTMITVFSLIHDGVEVARDVINSRVCAGPPRDWKKANGHGVEERPSRLKRARVASSSHSNPDKEPLSPPLSPLPSLEVHSPLNFIREQPDKDGYYTFTWRLKDRGIFNMLLMMKSGYAVREQQQQEEEEEDDQ